MKGVGGGEQNLQNDLENAVSSPTVKGGKSALNQMAGELGFEPRLTESESAVLPLNYSPNFYDGAHVAYSHGVFKLAAPASPCQPPPGRGPLFPPVGLTWHRVALTLRRGAPIQQANGGGTKR